MVLHLVKVDALKLFLLSDCRKEFALLGHLEALSSLVQVVVPQFVVGVVVLGDGRHHGLVVLGLGQLLRRRLLLRFLFPCIHHFCDPDLELFNFKWQSQRHAAFSNFTKN